MRNPVNKAHDELLTEVTRNGENPSEKLAHSLRAHWQVVVCPPSAREGRTRGGRDDKVHRAREGALPMALGLHPSPFSTVEMGPQVGRESSNLGEDLEIAPPGPPAVKSGR